MASILEDPSRYPLKCGSCHHGNPAGSKYCNACGASLAADPCPACGAINDAHVTACEQCGAALGEAQESDFFLPLPPEEPVEAEAQGGTEAAEASAASIDDTRPSAEFRAARAANDEPAAPLLPAVQSVTTGGEVAHEAPPDTATAAENVALQAAPAASVTEAGYQDSQASGRSGSTLKSLAAVAALAVVAYFAYGYFFRGPPGEPAPSASAREATGRASQSTPDKPAPVATDAARSAAREPDPALFAPDRSPPAASQATAGAGDTAGGNGGRGIEPAASSARPQTQADIFMTKPEPEQRRTPAAEAPKAAGSPEGKAGQRSCTDAVAALGLCTKDNN